MATPRLLWQPLTAMATSPLLWQPLTAMATPGGKLPGIPRFQPVTASPDVLSPLHCYPSGPGSAVSCHLAAFPLPMIFSLSKSSWPGTYGEWAPLTPSQDWRFECRASCMLGKCSTTELHTQMLHFLLKQGPRCVARLVLNSG